MNREDSRLDILLIVVLAAVLRLFRLGFQSLWFDEILTVLASSGSLTDVIFAPLANTRIPPLYYLVTHGLLGLGNEEFWIRLPSAVFGVASVVALFSVVRYWLGRSAAFWSALIMAVSPFHVWYSQEARPYALLILLSLIAVWFFQRLAHRPTDVGMRVGFVAVAAATVCCHTLGILFLGFLGVASLLDPWRRQWKSWFVNFAAIALLVAPALFLVTTYDLAPPAPQKEISNVYAFVGPYLVWNFGAGYSVGPSLEELHRSDRLEAVQSHLAVLIPTILLFASLAAYGLVASLRLGRRQFRLLLLWFGVPLALALAASTLPGETFNVRYAVLSFPAFVALLGVGLAGIPRRAVRGAVAALIVLVSLVSLRNYYHDDHYQREDNRAAGRFLAEHAVPGDLVLTSAGYTRLALEHYCDCDQVRFVEIQTDAGEVERGLHELGSRGRVWLFRSRSYHGDPDATVPVYLDGRGRRESEFSSNGVDLVLYRLGPGSTSGGSTAVGSASR